LKTLRERVRWGRQHNQLRIGTCRKARIDKIHNALRLRQLRHLRKQIVAAYLQIQPTPLETQPDRRSDAP
jgi:hypothetical protein